MRLSDKFKQYVQMIFAATAPSLIVAQKTDGAPTPPVEQAVSGEIQAVDALPEFLETVVAQGRMSRAECAEFMDLDKRYDNDGPLNASERLRRDYLTNKVWHLDLTDDECMRLARYENEGVSFIVSQLNRYQLQIKRDQGADAAMQFFRDTRAAYPNKDDNNPSNEALKALCAAVYKHVSGFTIATEDGRLAAYSRRKGGFYLISEGRKPDTVDQPVGVVQNPQPAFKAFRP